MDIMSMLPLLKTPSIIGIVNDESELVSLGKQASIGDMIIVQNNLYKDKLTNIILRILINNIEI